MYGTVRTVVWADGRGNPPSDPISRHGKALGNVVIWRMVYEQAEVA